MKYKNVSYRNQEQLTGRRHLLPSDFLLQHFRRLEHALGGIRAGFHLIGGSEGIGKSDFLVNLFLDFIQSNALTKCLYFTFKNDGQSVLNRMYACWTGIDILSIRDEMVMERDQCLMDLCKSEIKQYHSSDRMSILNADNLVEVIEILSREAGKHKSIALFLDGLELWDNGKMVNMLSQRFKIPVFATIDEGIDALPPDYAWDFFLLFKPGSPALGDVEPQQTERDVEIYLGGPDRNIPHFLYSLKYNRPKVRFREKAALLEQEKRVKNLIDVMDSEIAAHSLTEQWEDELSDDVAEAAHSISDSRKPEPPAPKKELHSEFMDLAAVLGKDKNTSGNSHTSDESISGFSKFLDSKINEQKRKPPQLSLEDTGQFKDLFPGLDKITLFEETPRRRKSDWEEDETGTIDFEKVEFFEMTNCEGFSKHQAQFRRVLAHCLLGYGERKEKEEREVKNDAPEKE